ncbi:aldehyde dehydrogenase [Actinosynnema sp. NPDC020468]|uniref:aldehyde dehydrogenase n=1 Tax=Actinosynnema sp. NPDC020468 TaxID=3154488 RepID=UPI00340ED7C3
MNAAAQTAHDRLFVDGDWVAPAGDAVLAVVNPHTEQRIGQVPDSTPADVDRAVAAARAAFDSGPWRRTSPAERAEVLGGLAAAFERERDTIVGLTTAEMGCPVSQSALINGVLPTMQLGYHAGLAADLAVEERRTGPMGTTVVRREPIGVVAAIVPWNGPIYLALNKILPALLAGCSVVLKPAPEASLGLLHLTGLIAASGLPAGVFNVVTGGREVGESLVAHPGVDRVSFTGSTAAGRRIAALCGERLKRVGLELGGKSAAIVLDDADLAATVEGLKTASLLNTGQICAAQSRLLVSHRRHDEFVDALVDAVGAMRVGDPTDPATEVGPLVSARQRDRVEGYLALGREEGAKTALGGGRVPGRATGWYVEPTVFTGVDNSMRVAREEIFGPVLTVIPFRDEEEAVAIANDSEYGLAGSVWTDDVERGLALSRAVRVGSYGVNCYTSDVTVPFGGFKASGLGREGGPEGVDEYFEFQSVKLPY